MNWRTRRGAHRALSRGAHGAPAWLVGRARAFLAAANSVGTAVGFVAHVNGGTEPTFGTRLQEISGILATGLAGIGIALAALSVGMWLTSVFAGALADRLGTTWVLSAGLCLCFGSFASIGFVFDVGVTPVPLLGLHLPVGLLIAQLLVGAGFALMDISLYRVSSYWEAEQMREGGSGKLENQATRAWYSAGNLVGAGFGYVAGVLAVPIRWHLLGWGVAALVLTLAFSVSRLPNLKGSPGEEGPVLPRGRRMMKLRQAAIVGAAAAFASVLAYNWSGIVLGQLGAPPAVAGLGLIVYGLAAVIGPLLVRRFSHRVRPVALVRLCAIGIALAIVLVAVPGTIYAALLGFALLGFAATPIDAAVKSAASSLARGYEGRGVGLAQRYLYLALLLTNGVGPLAEAIGLTLALLALVMFPALIFAFAPVMRGSGEATR